jgi:hypothetical protein
MTLHRLRTAKARPPIRRDRKSDGPAAAKPDFA